MVYARIRSSHKNLKKKKKAAIMDGGLVGLRGSNFDSIPREIILYIFSLTLLTLPLHSLLRLRFVCKSWYVLITESAETYLKLSRETSLGIISYCYCYDNYFGVDGRRGKFFLRINSLQIGGGFKALMTKSINTNTTSLDTRLYLLESINGLIGLCDAKENVHLCNPFIGEIVTLPCCDSGPVGRRRVIYVTGFGYASVTKQYKVIKLFGEYYKGKVFPKVKAAVITVGSSNSWRIVETPINNDKSIWRDTVFLDGTVYDKSTIWRNTIYLDGTIYWLNFYGIESVMIMAFDVSDETFRRINLPSNLCDQFVSWKCLEIYEGRLCLVGFIQHPSKCLDLYIMLQDHRWVFRHRVLLEDFQPFDVQPFDIAGSYCIRFSCLNQGKLILRQIGGREWVFYDIDSKVLEAVEIGNNGLNTPGFTVVFCPFEESLVPIPRG